MANVLDSLEVIAGGIAHDFNNLLVGVLGEATAAREHAGLPPETHESLRRIEAAARRMALLTRHLLAFSGRAQLVTVTLDADGLVGELRDQLAHMTRAEVQMDTGAEGAVIEGDAPLLRHAVLDLVTNASDAGATTIAIRTALDGNQHWVLDVIDDGTGIDPAVQARMFEPFFTTKPDHHGLGLSAVHGIVRRLGGTIEVESAPGRGARFRVRLPIVPGAQATRTRLSEPRGMPALKLAGTRALVADDEPSVRATVRRLLERRGASVVLASDGAEAAARLQAEAFDLLVLDVQMPHLTGHDVIDLARELHPTARIVLMSGYTQMRAEGSEEEPDAFLEKPFSAKALDATVDRVLNVR